MAQRKPGKQPGAEGTHPARIDDPGEILVHSPGRCEGSGADLAGGELGIESRQVFELPWIRPDVTEVRLERRRCCCGHEQKAAAPPEAIAPACYGRGVRALACYLAVYQHLPYERMAEVFADVLGMAVSVGALVSTVTDAGGPLKLFLEVTKDLLKEAPAVHLDETGARVQGSLLWVHVASTVLGPCSSATSHGAGRRSTRSASWGRWPASRSKTAGNPFALMTSFTPVQRAPRTRARDDRGG
ncbi:MAG: transposase [Actinomycetota bacterium]|nr:transposase [Actinomycetota bacterium]